MGVKHMYPSLSGAKEMRIRYAMTGYRGLNSQSMTMALEILLALKRCSQREFTKIEELLAMGLQYINTPTTYGSK